MAVTLRPLRELALDPASHPRGLSHLGAASGLVRVLDRFHVIADDEHHLAVFDAGSVAPGRLIRLLDGDLPASATKRKKKKPDLETLMRLPPTADWPAGALLALGSGSRPNRCTGVLLALDPQGDVTGLPRPIDLAPLYRGLEGRFAQLNIEGAFISDGDLVLLQRGNKGSANGRVRYPMDQVLAWLRGSSRPSPHPSSVTVHDLGSAGGVPLCFTDGAALDNGSWVFSAVAENTDDSYEDAPCAGAAIGVIDRDGILRSIAPTEPNRKIEGIEAQRAGEWLALTLVTDADDPALPAELLAATIPIPA